MKIFETILFIIEILLGALICGLPENNAGINLCPLGIVLIISGFMVLAGCAVESVVEKILKARNRETNIIVNLPKSKTNDSQETGIDDSNFVKDWEKESAKAMGALVEELIDGAKEQKGKDNDKH